jgi:hypothetical protein
VGGADGPRREARRRATEKRREAGAESVSARNPPRGRGLQGAPAAATRCDAGADAIGMGEEGRLVGLVSRRLVSGGGMVESKYATDSRHLPTPAARSGLGLVWFGFVVLPVAAPTTARSRVRVGEAKRDD